MKFIDLFAGIGGFRVALEQLGLECVFSSEIDYHARLTYKNNFGHYPAGDITRVGEFEIPSYDILCAGFPCQPFSISGKQLGFNDTRGTLFHEIARIAKYHMPKVIFLENVKNFVRHNQGKTFAIVCNSLEDLGYDVYYKVINASLYGVPQARERVYIIAFRKNLNIKDFSFPKPTYEEVYLKDMLLSNGKADSLFINRKDMVLYDDAEDKKKKKSLRPVRLGIVNKGGQGERIYSANGHAVTLSAYGGGVGAKTGLYLISGKIRKLHVEECKRLMTFPDNYILSNNTNQAYKQFGNAVIVKIIRIITKEVLRRIEWSEKKKTQKSAAKPNAYSLVS
ncbi:MAG: DNA (cytosine-5-)-methyltransferase [Candidatus Saelkia tenebricola]|nr:DNA (cytosine-5-)-methyltransferase [Candidatus Saelkia tenebricola]